MYGDITTNNYARDIYSGVSDDHYPLVTDSNKDISEVIKNTSVILNHLKENHLIDDSLSFSQLVTKLSRFIFCPNRDFKRDIQQYVKKLNYQNLVGFQLRYGSSMADVQEARRFLSLEQLPSIETKIHSQIKLNHTVFVCSDSSQVISFLEKTTFRHILTMKQYSRGHSAAIHHSSNNGSVLKGTVFDLAVLSFAKELFLTPRSSFGELACALSHANCSML